MHLACIVQQMQPSSKKNKQQQQQQVQPAEQLLAAVGLPESFAEQPGVPRLDVGIVSVMGRLMALTYCSSRSYAAGENRQGELSGAATAATMQQPVEEWGLLGQPHVATPLVQMLLQLCTQLPPNMVVIFTSMPLVLNIVRGSCVALQLTATAGTAATAGAAAGSLDGAALAALQPLLTLGPALLTAVEASNKGDATGVPGIDASRSAFTWSMVGCVLLDILVLGE
jgi:hypothetical protein